MREVAGRSRRARRAVLYCTVNGICNNTNGLGRQTKTLLATLDSDRDTLIGAVGPFDVHLAGPEPGPGVWSYDPDDLAYAVGVVRRWGGRVHSLSFDSTGPFWSVPVWRSLCRDAAHVARKLRNSYEEILLIGVDTPFAGVAHALAAGPGGWPAGVRALLVFYSTARIVERPHPDGRRVDWEQLGVDAANAFPDAWVADIGRFLTGHLRAEYGLCPDRLVPFPSGMHFASPELRPMPEDEARDTATAWGVPGDRPIVLTIGRTDPTKGIDILLDALAPLRDDVHVVVIAVPLPGQGHLLDAYREQIGRHGLRATLVDRYTRDLPRALCALPETRVVACPSRGETLANVPFEVALWGQRRCDHLFLAPPEVEPAHAKIRRGGYAGNTNAAKTGAGAAAQADLRS